MKKEFVYAGQIIVSKTPMELYTVLGSCISVCIWDNKLRIGGMNHYMLPLWKRKGLATPKYGDIAIPKLIEKVINLGG
ncbi:MAG: chemotaxis protein CheD, partial [Candidatus Cloacimonadota bacterium]|nr:chemotaxis protein CheD [Candidatus Cloacimonadota bacterium]